MKQPIQLMLVGKNVTKLKKTQLKLAGMLFIFLLVYGCKTVDLGNVTENVEVVKFSSSHGTYINVQLFDKNKRNDSLPAFINVNGVYFHSNYDMFHHRLQVKPGTYDIESFFISKEPSKVRNLRINKNDSIILKIFMKDETSPIE